MNDFLNQRFQSIRRGFGSLSSFPTEHKTEGHKDRILTIKNFSGSPSALNCSHFHPCSQGSSFYPEFSSVLKLFGVERFTKTQTLAKRSALWMPPAVNKIVLCKIFLQKYYQIELQEK